MVMLTFELPAGSPRGPVVIVIVLEKENIQRMWEADPFDIHLGRVPEAQGLAVHRRVRDIDLIIAYEEDLGILINFRESQDLAGLMNWLERGRKIKPGDLARPIVLRKT